MRNLIQWAKENTPDLARQVAGANVKLQHLRDKLGRTRIQTAQPRIDDKIQSLLGDIAREEDSARKTLEKIIDAEKDHRRQKKLHRLYRAPENPPPSKKADSVLPVLALVAGLVFLRRRKVENRNQS